LWYHASQYVVSNWLVGNAIIDAALQKHYELSLIKASEPKIRSANDFIHRKG
jgi:hypothetical protein